MLLADALVTGIPTDSWTLWFIHFFFEIFTSLLAIFLILLVLVQRGRGGGIAGALGGMGGNSAFGTKAGDTFTWITYVTAAIWIMLAMLTIKTFTDPHADKARAQANQKETLDDEKRQATGTGSKTGAESTGKEDSDTPDSAGGATNKNGDQTTPDKEPDQKIDGESKDSSPSEPKSDEEPATKPSDKPQDKPDSEPKPEEPGETPEDQPK